MSFVGKPIECKAAVCWKAGEPFVIENVTVDPPKDDEIRFKTVATGICSSDISLQKGNPSLTKFPLIAGHETSAIVESVGENVKSVAVGDAIIPIWTVNCGECGLCELGTRNICEKLLTGSFAGVLKDGTTRISCKGHSIRHGTMVAGFSEYSVIPDGCFIKIPSGAPLDKVCLFACCVPTGYGAAKYACKVRQGSTVAIYGLGAVGLCAALGCKDSQASKIIAIDVNEEKEEIGKACGVSDFVNAKELCGKPTSEIIKELTSGLGVDYVFVCVGKSSVITEALAACKFNGGEVMVIGIPPIGETLCMAPIDLILGKTLKGSICGDCEPKEILSLIELYVNGTLKTDHLITDVLPLERINEGFNLLRESKCVRTVIKF